MTASQFPVAIRPKSLFQFCEVKSSLPATRMFAPGYSVSSSVENWPSMWFGTENIGFRARPSRFSSIAAATIVNVFPLCRARHIAGILSFIVVGGGRDEQGDRAAVGHGGEARAGPGQQCDGQTQRATPDPSSRVVLQAGGTAVRTGDFSGATASFVEFHISGSGAGHLRPIRRKVTAS